MVRKLLVLLGVSTLVAFGAGVWLPAFAAGPQPGAPSYFSAPPGGAGTVNEGGGVTAAQLTSGPEPSPPPYGYGGVSVSFPTGTTFSQLTNLGTMYNMTQGTCGLGAPRFQIDLANPNTHAYAGTLYAYIGPGASANGDPCPAADNSFQVQPNVATNSDPDVMRWDAASGGAGGSQTQSFAQVQATYGTDLMLDAQIVVDGGYGAVNAPNYTQQVLIENWNVNGKIYFASPGGNANCSGQLPPGTYQNVTVQSGQSCTIDGTNVITGNVTVQNGGSLQDGDSANGGATIGGNLQANQAAWIAVGYGGSVGGDLQVTGTTSEPGNTHGNPDGANYLCNTVVGGNVTVQGSGSGAPFDIGSAPDCGIPLTIAGNLTVQSNAANALVGPAVNGSGNSVKGNITVQNNTGGGQVENNASTNGSCQLHGDNPVFSPASGNTTPAGKTNTCNTPG